MGVALMQLEETLHELAARFGLRPRTCTWTWDRSAGST